MSKRQRLASLLHQTGVMRAALALRSSVPSPWLSVLTYHRFPTPGGHETFDDEVIDVTPECFERQVVFLKKYFNVIGVEELCAFADGKPLPPNAVAITFDDGYLDNYEVALPILKRHDAKAVFFIATGCVGERRLYFWDRVAYVLKRTGRDRVHLTYPFAVDIALADRKLALERILRIVKTHPALNLERFLDELGHAAQVAWSRHLERSFAERLLMTWDHVRELRRAGMDVQSHTRSHRVLDTLPPADLLDELAGSREDLQRELGELPRAIAYPVGNQVGATSPIRAALAQAGYAIGLSSNTGSNSLHGVVDRYNIRRQAVELNLPDAYLLAVLAMPSLAHKQPWQVAAE
ncbi:MAG TPA: polysaccharide deacetylase family protein [Polyangiaceae bacterium]|nr:polysaccharide deacetylase family protein [Polyangiaceae bacterium]